MPIFLDYYSNVFYFGIQAERICYNWMEIKVPAPSQCGKEHRRAGKAWLPKQQKTLVVSIKAVTIANVSVLQLRASLADDEGLSGLWARSRHSSSDGMQHYQYEKQYQYWTHCRGSRVFSVHCDVWQHRQNIRLWSHYNKLAITAQGHECYEMGKCSTCYNKSSFLMLEGQASLPRMNVIWNAF